MTTGPLAIDSQSVGPEQCIPHQGKVEQQRVFTPQSNLSPIDTSENSFVPTENFQMTAQVLTIELLEGLGEDFAHEASKFRALHFGMTNLEEPSDPVNRVEIDVRKIGPGKRYDIITAAREEIRRLTSNIKTPLNDRTIDRMSMTLLRGATLSQDPSFESHFNELPNPKLEP